MTQPCEFRLFELIPVAGRNTFYRFLIAVCLLMTNCVFADCLKAQSVTDRPANPNSVTGCNAGGVKSIRRTTEPYVKKSSKNTVDWTTMASTYTHDPEGQRVDQFSSGVEPVVIERPDFVRSGYRHTRSTLQAGSSADHYHSVEQWGPNVRPYGEWRYPTRPFSVPYPMWGPQLPQVLGGGFPWGGAPFGVGANGGNAGGMMPASPMQPNWQPNLGVGPGNALTPLHDDYYAPAPIYNPPTNGLEMP